MAGAADNADVPPCFGHFLVHVAPQRNLLLAERHVAGEGRFVPRGPYRGSGIGRIRQRGFLLTGGERGERRQYGNCNEAFHADLVMSRPPAARRQHGRKHRKEVRYARISRALRGSGEGRALGPVGKEQIVELLRSASLRREIRRQCEMRFERKSGDEVVAAQVIGVISRAAVVTPAVLLHTVILRDALIVFGLDGVSAMPVFAL